jgi:hypothetical protein
MMIPMNAFLIAKNGKRQCLAGVGSSGVLTAIATWVKSPRKPKSERIWLTVGGLTERHEHLRWAKDVPLAVGDEITIRLVKVAKVDRPVEQKKRNRRVAEQAKRAYYEKLRLEFEKPSSNPQTNAPTADGVPQ